MKKLFAVLLIFTMLLSLFACGKSESAAETTESTAESAETQQEAATAAEGASTEASNPILEYLDLGYQASIEVGDALKIVFTSPDRTDFVQVDAAMTEEEITTYCELDFFAEDYDAQERAVFAGLTGEITVTSLNDQIPTQEEMDTLVGKTFGELEDMGYEQTSVDGDEEGRPVLIYSDELYDYMCTPSGNYEDLLSLSEVDLTELTVEKVAFYGFQ